MKAIQRASQRYRARGQTAPDPIVQPRILPVPRTELFLDLLSAVGPRGGRDRRRGPRAGRRGRGEKGRVKVDPAASQSSPRSIALLLTLSSPYAPLPGGLSGSRSVS